MGIIDGVLKKDVRSLARAISLIENRNKEGIELLKRLEYPNKAYVIGITGNPGAGKSTVVDKLIDVIREKNKRVGIIAIDPSSPFTGGALLGDRIRMQKHATDSKVFIRSLGSRGDLGGLSHAVVDTIALMDFYEFDYIIVETVGAGQNEVEIVEVADTTVVIMVPGLGDEIQNLKAGIMEIGDIFVANKIDKPGADQLLISLKIALQHSPEKDGWTIPIIKTNAETSQGIPELFDFIEKHKDFLFKTSKIEKRRFERKKYRLISGIKEKVLDTLEDVLNYEEYINSNVYESIDKAFLKLKKGSRMD
jgi:LAO/AO transport system kinase